VDIRITAGEAGDAPVGEEMVDSMDVRDGITRAAMDKAYDSNAIRTKLEAKGIEAVIPPKCNRLDIIVYDKERYKERNKVERLFNKNQEVQKNCHSIRKTKNQFSCLCNTRAYRHYAAINIL
jgi:transposase